MSKLQKEKPHKIVTDLEELEVMLRLRDSTEWVVLKRWMKRYIDNLKSISFNMSYVGRSEDFKVRHRELTAQAMAFKNLVRVVEDSGKKLEEREKG